MAFSYSILLYGRMQDIELMHMRYALDSAVLALGVMEKSMTAENNQVAFRYLKDLQNHLEAVTTIPRKVIYSWLLFLLE